MENGGEILKKSLNFFFFGMIFQCQMDFRVCEFIARELEVGVKLHFKACKGKSSREKRFPFFPQHFHNSWFIIHRENVAKKKKVIN